MRETRQGREDDEDGKEFARELLKVEKILNLRRRRIRIARDAPGPRRISGNSVSNSSKFQGHV